MTDVAHSGRRASLLLGLLLVAACTARPGTSGGPSADSSAAATTPSPTPAAAQTTPAVPAPAPSNPAPASPRASPTGAARPTLSALDVPHTDPSLEALLPARIGDVELIRMSAPGTRYDTGGDMCTFVCPLEARMMAEGVGAEVDDVTLAFAFDAALERYALVAFRVRGASGIQLRDARLALLDSEAPYPFIAEKAVGDTAVTVAIRSWFPNDTHFLVARGDALVVIRHATGEHDGLEPVLPDEVAAIVAVLP